MTTLSYVPASVASPESSATHALVALLQALHSCRGRPRRWRVICAAGQTATSDQAAVGPTVSPAPWHCPDPAVGPAPVSVPGQQRRQQGATYPYSPPPPISRALVFGPPSFSPCKQKRGSSDASSQPAPLQRVLEGLSPRTAQELAAELAIRDPDSLASTLEGAPRSDSLADMISPMRRVEANRFVEGWTAALAPGWGCATMRRDPFSIRSGSMRDYLARMERMLDALQLEHQGTQEQRLQRRSSRAAQAGSRQASFSRQETDLLALARAGAGSGGSSVLGLQQLLSDLEVEEQQANPRSITDPLPGPPLAPPHDGPVAPLERVSRSLASASPSSSSSPPGGPNAQGSGLGAGSPALRRSTFAVGAPKASNRPATNTHPDPMPLTSPIFLRSRAREPPPMPPAVSIRTRLPWIALLYRISHQVERHSPGTWQASLASCRNHFQAGI